MQNQRKTTLLSQVEGWKTTLPIRGVVRLNEKENVLTVVFLNLEERSDGEYFLVVGKSLFKIESISGQDFAVAGKLQDGCTLAIIFYNGEQVFPVLAGNFSMRETNLEEALEYAKMYFTKQNEKKEERVAFQTEGYDDEALADVNYYELERAYSSRGEGVDIDELANNQNLNYCEEQSGKEEKERNFGKEESFSAGYGESEQANCNYYRKIKDELESVFKDYPKEENLCKMVNSSKWVKIGDGAKHYAVGIIYKQSEPKYICYGLPGAFNSKPTDAESFSSFIPTSPFNLKGEGYWVTFQNANDGKCAK